jgi:GDP-L-fucose synthase
MKVLVTGAYGLAGSAIRRAAQFSHHDFVFCGRSHADLRDWTSTNDLISYEKPDYVINCAARVGGIAGNMAMHADFLYDNLMMNANVLKSCAENGVKKVLSFSSVCVFPDDLALLEEDKMHTGPVYENNFAYGYAKRIVDIHITALRKQYGVTNYCSVIPSNIFGPNDQFDLEYGHVVPSLIHKFYLAKQNGTAVTVWGDGRSLREFMYIDDLADCLLALLDKPSIPQRLNITGEKEQSIKEVVEALVDVTGYDNVAWDLSKPNGQRCRPTSKARFREYFPDFQYTPIQEGLYKTWNWFCENYPNVRVSY